ncbi:MAG: TonB-dependent receptor [Acidobacteria bacterium]|nr:TonB-dependent receptor [Acidobacteriota bacterium]
MMAEIREAAMVGRQFSVIVLGLSLFCVPALIAQTTGSFAGRVQDESGAVIPNAEVTVQNTDTGISRIVQSDQEGRFHSPRWSPGNYEITARVQGFQAETRRGIRLAVGQEAVIDFSLRVGTVAESVVVTGEAPIVETTSAATSGMIEGNQVRELPLNGRSLTDLFDLQPLVIKLAAGSTSLAEGYGIKYSVAGSRPDQVNFTIDGLNVNDVQNATPGGVAGVLLGSDTIREFRMYTGNFGAQFGRVSGGVMVAVTQSGTNALHGSVFEFLRNSALDARKFFDVGGLPPFRMNQFGFTLGGPIIKDRTFFFGSYEGLRQRLTSTARSRVPTLQTRRGILPSGPCVAGCTVASSVQAVFDLYPPPNSRDFVDGTAEFINTTSEPTGQDFFAVKVDHVLSDKHSFFARYSFDDGDKLSPDDFEYAANTGKTRNQYAALEATSVLSPAFLNTARVGVNRSVTLTDIKLLVPAERQAPLTFIPGKGPGSAGVSGFFSISGGSGTSPRLFRLTSYQISDEITWVRGGHSLKIGGFFQRDQNNENVEFSSRGAYTFNTIEDFFAARPNILNSWVRAENTGIRGFRQSIFGGYLQDDIRVSQRLTLNLGVRYEAISDPTEVNGRITTLPNLSDPQITTGGKFWNNPSLKNFAPRLGLALDLFGNGKTAIRAGWGIYYETIMHNYYRLPGYLNPPLAETVLYRTQPIIFPNAVANFAGLKTQPRLETIEFDLRQPYKMNYNFDIQQEIFSDLALSIGYNGARGVHLIAAWPDVNQPRSFVGPDGRVTIPRGQPRPNTNFTQIRHRSSDNNTSYNAFKFSLTKRFSHGFQFRTGYTWSKALDNSSLVVSQGTDFDGNADGPARPFSHAVEWAPANYDVRQYFTSNFTLDLPVGPGRSLGGDLTGVGGKLLEGWGANMIFTAASGPPFSATLSYDNAGALPQGGGGGQRPDLKLGFSNNPVLENYRQDTDHYFDVNAFTPSPTGTFGNLGRNTLVGPGRTTVDFSVSKNTGITERTRLQFRAEFFNLFNRANFRLPSSGVFVAGGRLSATAGRITNTFTARQIQFGLKLIF